MEKEKALDMLRLALERTYDMDDRSFLILISNIMENPAAFARFCRILYSERVENHDLYVVLKELPYFEEMVASAAFYNEDPNARSLVDAWLGTLEESFHEAGLETPNMEDIRLCMLTYGRSANMLVKASEYEEKGERVSNPLDQINENFPIKDDSMIINFFLSTFLDTKSIGELAGLLGNIFMGTHPFVDSLHKEQLLGMMVKASAQGKNVDNAIKEGVRRYFKKNGVLLDLNQARNDYNSYISSIKAHIMFEDFDSGKISLEEVFRNLL